MHNKDVSTSAYLASMVCLLMVPLLVHAHNLDPDITDNDVYRSNDSTHESYEDFLPMMGSRSRHRKKSSEKKPIIKSKPVHSYSNTLPTYKTAFTSYTVRKKDTLTKIARKFNISVATVKKYNRVNDQHSIKTGVILKIPVINKNTTGVKKTDTGSLILNQHDIPQFRWPIPRVIKYKNDGLDGVKSIGIIITGIQGSKVLSSSTGIVKKIGYMRGFGKYIVINHPRRFNTVYANLSEIRVYEGKKVESGMIIGRIHTSESKLHFQIDLGGKPENPLKYLPKKI